MMLVLCLLLAGCRGASDSVDSETVTLTVFAAASLTDAFGAIEEAYEAQHPTVNVQLNLAGSQQLAQQLRLGAPADVFASANPIQMEAAIAAGRVAPDATHTFARNRLVVITPPDNPGGITDLRHLAGPGVRLVLADAAVPVGRYARQFLQNASRDPAWPASFEEDVLDRVASFEQNVRAVLTKVALGEADAGVVYVSDPGGADEAAVQVIHIPDRLNVAATYPIAPVRDSAHPEVAASFIDFVLTEPGQSHLAQYGFIPIITP